MMIQHLLGSMPNKHVFSLLENKICQLRHLCSILVILYNALLLHILPLYCIWQHCDLNNNLINYVDQDNNGAPSAGHVNCWLKHQIKALKAIR